MINWKVKAYPNKVSYGNNSEPLSYSEARHKLNIASYKGGIASKIVASG